MCGVKGDGEFWDGSGFLAWETEWVVMAGYNSMGENIEKFSVWNIKIQAILKVSQR